MTESQNSNINPYAPVSTVDAATERRLTLATPIPISGRLDIDDALIANGIRSFEWWITLLGIARPLIALFATTYSPLVGSTLLALTLCGPSSLFVRWVSPSIRKSRQKAIDSIGYGSSVLGVVADDELILHSDDGYTRMRWDHFRLFNCRESARICLVYRNQLKNCIALPARFFCTHDEYQRTREFLNSLNSWILRGPRPKASEWLESSANVTSDATAPGTIDYNEAKTWDAENWPFERTASFENADVPPARRDPIWISYRRIVSVVHIVLRLTFTRPVLIFLSWLIFSRLHAGNFSFVSSSFAIMFFATMFFFVLYDGDAPVMHALATIRADLKISLAKEGIYLGSTTYESWWKWEKISHVEIKSRSVVLYLHPDQSTYNIAAERFESKGAFRAFAYRLEGLWQARRSRLA